MIFLITLAALAAVMVLVVNITESIIGMFEKPVQHVRYIRRDKELGKVIAALVEEQQRKARKGG